MQKSFVVYTPDTEASLMLALNTILTIWRKLVIGMILMQRF